MANAKYDISGIPTALGVDTAGTIHPLLTDTAGTLLTSTSSAPADISQTGAISSNTSVTLSLTGQASVTVQIVNTGFTGTLNFEESIDGGTTYQSVALWPVGSTATGNLIINKAYTTDSTTSLYEGNVSAASNFRVRGSSVSAGSSAITLRGGLSTSAVVLDGPLPTGSNTIGAVTTASALANPTVFKTVTATANGSTAVWTPAAGKKFRVVSYSLSITNNGTGAAANTEVTLLDAAVATGIGASFYTPTTVASAVGAGTSGPPPVQLGNGFLSSTINNVLNVNLSQVLTNGEVRVTVCGTEE